MIALLSSNGMCFADRRKPFEKLRNHVSTLQTHSCINCILGLRDIDLAIG
jgi:hypothetical protein